MDSEIQLFKLKLKTLTFPKRAWWLASFFVKRTYYFVERKLRRFLSQKRVEKSIRTIENHDYAGIFLKHFKPLHQRSNITDETVYFKVKEKAETILSGNWRLAGKDFTFQEPFNWSQEHDDEQDWHSIHRHRELVYLAIAIQFYPDNEKYWKYIRLVIHDWIDKNPPTLKPGWHPYTLSERLVHWCWILQNIPTLYLQSDRDWLNLVFNSIHQQAVFLQKNMEWHLGIHNHILNNSRALLTVAVSFSFLKDKDKWVSEAIRAIDKVLPHQLLADGAHSEQSSSYHLLITRTVWEYKQLYGRAGIDFPYKDALHKMIQYAISLARPDGTVPLLGHISPDWPMQELFGLIPDWTGSEKKNKASLLSYIYGYDQTSLSIEKPNHLLSSTLFSDAGTGILRRKDWHVVLSCDPRCRIMTHGDQNMFGIDIWCNGQSIVRDAGLHTYNLNSERDKMESWLGQSAFIIDNAQPYVIDWRRRQLPKAYFYAESSLRKIDNYSIEAEHTCYHRLPNPVNVFRKVSVPEDHQCIIEDSVEGDQGFYYSALFNLGDLRIEQTTRNTIKCKGKSNDNYFLITWDVQFDMDFREGDFSNDYGSLQKSTVLKLSKKTIDKVLHSKLIIEILRGNE